TGGCGGFERVERRREILRSDGLLVDLELLQRFGATRVGEQGGQKCDQHDRQQGVQRETSSSVASSAGRGDRRAGRALSSCALRVLPARSRTARAPARTA